MNRPEMSSQSESQPNSSNATSLLFRVVLVGLLAVTLYGVFLMNQQRIRTRQAMVRVQMIQDAIEQWQSQNSKQIPEGAEPPVPSSAEDLASVNPEAVKWLTDGDEYYKYKFSGMRFEGGNLYALITADAWDPSNVFGEEVISTPGGMATIGRFSPAGRRFSLPDFARAHPFTVGAFIVLFAAGLWINLGRRR